MDAQRLYVPLKDRGIVALDRQNGDMDWRNDTNANWPLVVDGGVLYAASGHDLFAIDAATGDVRWHASLAGAVIAPIGLQQGLVVAVTEPDGVLAYHASTGQIA